MKKIITHHSIGGFTLIELLMVMAIVSVLAGLFLVTFPATQKRGRDTKRKSDIKQYQTALEVYANKNGGFYPRRDAGSGQLAHTTLCGDLSFSSGECPEDPRYGQNNCSGNACEYRYQTESCGAAGDPCATTYVLWGSLEQPQDNDYWILCSNGQTGEGSTTPSGGNCPL